MKIEELYKAKNTNTGEIKLFCSPGSLRIFLKKNREWIGVGK